MTPDQQNDLLIRLDERTENIETNMTDLCKLAKSEDGFTRCGRNHERISGLEKTTRLIVAALLIGAVKMVFFGSV